MKRITRLQNCEIDASRSEGFPIEIGMCLPQELLERATVNVAQCRSTLEWILDHDDQHGFLPFIYRKKIDEVLSALKQNAIMLAIKEDGMAYELDMALFFDTATKAVTVGFRGKAAYLPGP